MPPPPPTSRRGAPGGQQRVLKQALWLVLAIAVIGTSLFAGSLVFGDDGSSDSGPSPSIAPLTSAAPTPSATGSPSASPSTAQPSKATMTAFVSRYLGAVTTDPATAWGSLTPGFQRTSGGFADYRAFWAPISSAEPSNLMADPEAGTVSYDVRYTYASGRTTTDSTRLTLRYQNGTYAITGEG